MHICFVHSMNVSQASNWINIRQPDGVTMLFSLGLIKDCKDFMSALRDRTGDARCSYHHWEVSDGVLRLTEGFHCHNQFFCGKQYQTTIDLSKNPWYHVQICPERTVNEGHCQSSIADAGVSAPIEGVSLLPGPRPSDPSSRT